MKKFHLKLLNFQNDIVCNPGYGIGEVEAKELFYSILYQIQIMKFYLRQI